MVEINLNKKIVREVVVQATPEAVWKKWTSSEGIGTFFTPHNKVDLRIGGPFEMHFDQSKPEGDRGSEGCQFLAYLPYKMLSFSWNAPHQFEAIRNGDVYTWVVVEINSISEKLTHVKLSHLGWYEHGQWPEVYAYFEKAWTYVMDNFEKSFD